MLLRTVYTKAIRDRWLAMVIAVTVLALFLLYTMALYREIDLSIYTDLPESMRVLVGIAEGADAASLSYSVMLNFTAALTLAGLAISMGAASIAGEERKGTLGLLLSNPRTRSRVLVGKSASMVTLTVLGGAVLLAAGYGVPSLLEVEIGDSHVGATMVHLVLNALFYGFLATAVGAWTGNRSLASGVSGGILIVSYFAVGLLPLDPDLAGLARAFPWYYFDRSDPLVNGFGWSHLAVLGGGIVVLGALALVGVNRRDLRSRSVARTPLDQLRANPVTRAVFDRLAGSARVSRLWVKTTSEHQGLLIVTAVVMFFMMGVLLGPMYVAIEDNLVRVAGDLPEAVLAIAGGGDLGTPEGFYRIETFALSAPIAVMIVSIVIGARGLAGEEAQRTMGLLLANPIRRSTVVVQQALAMVVYAVVVGLATFGGVTVGSLISNLDLSIPAVAATSGLVTLLGLVFGALALALGAATGRVRVAVYGAVGVALASHLVNAYLPLSDRFAPYARWTPNYYYLSSDPLINGMPWAHGAVLAALVVVIVGAAVVLFNQRDIRSG